MQPPIDKETDMHHSLPTENRRQFLRRSLWLGAAFPFWVVTTGACQTPTNRSAASRLVGGGCDGCEAIYEGMPSALSWQTRIATENEPGERMELRGVVYRADGKTPAPNIILYAYHTDVTGLYVPTAQQTGQARRHGRLRGWVKTNAQGEYQFTTIKPVPYPQRDIPAHVHLTVKEPDKNEYYIDEAMFEVDPLLTSAQRAKLAKRGGSGLLPLTKDGSGGWRGQRNIILGQNIPNYL
jgi:protocatechuate 3,4-dioxygenase beta subunit